MRSDILNVNSNNFGNAANMDTGEVMPLQYKDKIVLLTDQGSATTIRPALTGADSGTHFIVPALTSGTQSITLPEVSDANVGCWYRFTMLATAGQIFSVDTAASADKIINWEPDGDGSGTKNASSDGFNFTASAIVGASFKITSFTLVSVLPGVSNATSSNKSLSLIFIQPL